jgi:hypothetical protein
LILRQEFRLKSKDGFWKTYEVTARNLLADPLIAGIVINARDVTDRKRLEQRLTVQYQASRILAQSESLGRRAPTAEGDLRSLGGTSVKCGSWIMNRTRCGGWRSGTCLRSRLRSLKKAAVGGRLPEGWDFGQNLANRLSSMGQ